MSQWTKTDSEELRKLVEKATPGKWITRKIDPEHGVLYVQTQTGATRQDFLFIDMARTAVPLLLDHVEKLEAENEKLTTIVMGGNEVLDAAILALTAENAKLRKVVEAAKKFIANTVTGNQEHCDLEEALSELEGKP